MRPYPRDIPQDTSSEASYDCEQAAKHLRQIRNSGHSITEERLSNVNTLNDLISLISNEGEEFQRKAIEHHLEKAITSVAQEQTDAVEELMNGDAQLSQKNSLVNSVQNRIPKKYRYDDPVNNEDFIIEEIQRVVEEKSLLL